MAGHSRAVEMPPPSCKRLIVFHSLGVLSPRELQVFDLLWRGRDITEIVAQLSLDHKTVKQYRQRIKAKLKVNSAPEVLRGAVLWTNSPFAKSEL